MADAHAALSSVATSLRELTDRVEATAAALMAEGDESGATDLYEVERALRTAQRKLARVVDPRP
jgi:hypothetical protein